MNLSPNAICESVNVRSEIATQWDDSELLNDIPDCWKHATVHPILKSGVPADPNYRPISILPVITKVMEMVVHHQLQNYLSKLSVIVNPT